jgi:hypothetical protein
MNNSNNQGNCGGGGVSRRNPPSILLTCQWCRLAFSLPAVKCRVDVTSIPRIAPGGLPPQTSSRPRRSPPTSALLNGVKVS